jgi:hypothetical protein
VRANPDHRAADLKLYAAPARATRIAPGRRLFGLYRFDHERERCSETTLPQWQTYS